MRFKVTRVVAVIIAVTTFSLFSSGFSINSLADKECFLKEYFLANAPHSSSGQQKEKPKLQKPERPLPAEQEAPAKDQDTIQLRADLVLLDVTAVDPNNKPVMNLTKEQFKVFEDKVPQDIADFSRDEVPVSLVFAIDTSGSMRAKLDTVIKASSNLVKESRRDDEIAVIEFKDQPEVLEEFTTDIHDVIDTLEGLIASSQTAMLDALYLASEYADKEGRNRRKAVIMVTDGLDRDSYYKFDEVVDRLREVDVQIYLVGFTNDLSKDGKWIFKKSEKEKAEELLNRLATETGGQAFFPRELSEVHTIAKQISTDLRTQYSIGYYSTNSKRDGTFRSIKVQVDAGNQRVIARTRAGYTAPREGARQTPNK
ncbi:MAG: VWA domain-containing protein [Blastocatellia bacterium]|nr:VWA domain-containing protein [Blastocatellia bacterium]